MWLDMGGSAETDRGGGERPAAPVVAALDPAASNVLHVLAELADGVVVVDRRGIIRYANDAAVAMFDRPRSELLGHEFGFPVTAGRTTEIEVLRPGGAPVTAELRVVETRWSGEPVLVVSLRDITDRRAAAERAQQLQVANAARAEAEAASRAKSDFLATMSHELRTPLNAVLGYAQLLDIGVGGPLTDAQRAQIDRIIASGRHLLGLVDELLDIAKIEAGHLAVHDGVCSARAAMADAMTLVRPQAESAGVELVPPGPAEDAAIEADQNRVRQTLVNLLGNAIKFTLPGGRVWVTIERDALPPASARVRGAGPWVAIRVHDTGIGIDPENHERIFAPFVQIEGGRTRRHDGSGLGLTISRRIARLMKGDVTVASAGGRGSVFTLWLHGTGDRAARILTGDPVSREATAVLGLREAGEAILEGTAMITEGVVERLRSGSIAPGVEDLRFSQLADHLPTLLGDIAACCIALAEARGAPSPLVQDGSDIQQLVSERHGAQRARLGWTRGALEREHTILREEIERVIARALGGHSTPGVTNARSVVQELLARMESASLNALERSAGRLPDATHTRSPEPGTNAPPTA